MRVIRIVAAVFASAVVACGGAGELAETAPAAADTPTTASAEVDGGSAAVAPDAPATNADAGSSDSATGWVYDAGGPLDECSQTVFTQELCYGTSAPSSGTSRGGACADAGTTAGCTVLTDPYGANPPVWCCP